MSKLQKKLENLNIIFLLFILVIDIGFIIIDVFAFPVSRILFGVFLTIIVLLTLFLIYGFFIKIRKIVYSIALKTKYGKKYLLEYEFKSFISFCFTFCINFFYSIFLLFISLYYKSTWFSTLAIYYICLATMKCNILLNQYKRKKIQKEKDYYLLQVKSFRNSGFYLCVFTIALSLEVFIMIKFNNGMRHTGLMLYAVGIHTIYKLSISIYNFLKAKKYDNYTTQSIRNINLVTTFISILSLQITIFKTFDTKIDSFPFNLCTGICVLCITLCIGLSMIIQGQKKIKQIIKLKK